MIEVPSPRIGPSRPTLVAVPEPAPEGQPTGPHAVAWLELERALMPPRRPVAAVPEPLVRVDARTLARAAEPETVARPAAAPAEPESAARPAATPAERQIGARPAATEQEPALVRALRAELAMRAAAEAGLRARALDAETRLAARVLVSQRTAATLDQIRSELDRLGEMLGDERARRQTAELRAAELEPSRRRVTELEDELATYRDRSDRAEGEDEDRVGGELQSLRESLRQLQAPGQVMSTVEPDRLADALTRLRATSEPIAGVLAAPVVAATGAMPTLVEPFRRMCRADPSVAGRLVESLLGLQASACPRPLSYDLLLGAGHGSVQVTSAAGAVTIVRAATARPREHVEFQVVGDHARLAKLLAAGRLRRRLGLGVARVRGNRRGVDALDALLRMPLNLPALIEGGMVIDADVLLSLVAAMIEPDWTRGERFAISHCDGRAAASYLLVSDGRAASVTRAQPQGRIATTITCTGADLATLLAGRGELGSDRVQLHGDRGPLTELQCWVKRAQCE